MRRQPLTHIGLPLLIAVWSCTFNTPKTDDDSSLGGKSSGGAASGGKLASGGTTMAGMMGGMESAGQAPGGAMSSDAGAGGSAGSIIAGGGGMDVGMGGSGDMAGEAGSAGSAGDGPSTREISPPIVLPTPLGADDVSRPSGDVGGLTVLDWAGFPAAVSFTFDDSLPSQLDHYDELNDTGRRFTFFLVQGKDQSDPQWGIIAADGHELGNHTAHHCYSDGTSCSWGAFAGSVDAEYDNDTAHIIEKFGVKDVYTAAAPFGDAGWKNGAASRFLANRGISDGRVKPNDATDPFWLPCHLSADKETFDPPETGTAYSGFKYYLDGAIDGGEWQIFLVHSFDVTGADGGYHPVDITEMVKSIEYAKDNDIWVDSMVNVAAYWRAQKLIAALTPETVGDDQVYTWSLPDHFPGGEILRVTLTGGTPKQNGVEIPWDSHGYYEVQLDYQSLTISP